MDESHLRLTLSLPQHQQQQPHREQQQQQHHQNQQHHHHNQQQQQHRSQHQRIEPLYPWSTDRRAVVHSFDYLRSMGINKVRGDVTCKRCDGTQSIEVEVEPAFEQVNTFFLANRDTMHDRAPRLWTSPRLLDCVMCLQGDCVKPVIHAKKRHINWLFLLLTQTLGLCTLDQLKYFCKHTRRHRTGAKDRVLYLTYVGLLKQLNPSGPYE